MATPKKENPLAALGLDINSNNLTADVLKLAREELQAEARAAQLANAKKELGEIMEQVKAFQKAENDWEKTKADFEKKTGARITKLQSIINGDDTPAEAVTA
jgi:hypothetical protein